jgi:hypothetical protein
MLLSVVTLADSGRLLENRICYSPELLQVFARFFDSSNSSDALLMNCFCYPGASVRLARTIGAFQADAKPQFGYPGRVHLSDGSTDDTELDMPMGGTIVEAKLTERDFTSRPKAHVRRYAALDEVFDIDCLPAVGERFHGYQLIRNVLAAEQHNKALIVLLDYRRPDLLDQWWQVHSAISSSALRKRCWVRFWQQLAAAADPPHRELLKQKYDA